MVLQILKKTYPQLQFKDIFDGVFISEETGYQKPMIEFLIMFLKKLVRTKSTIIVGDSLTSDVLGGKMRE